jgi:hypothetical protein
MIETDMRIASLLEKANKKNRFQLQQQPMVPAQATTTGRVLGGRRDRRG